MPPKAKFTREFITENALQIARINGPNALTARALGTKLGSSARPIFTVFHSMEEVQQEVILAAKRIYREYIEIGLKETPAFRGVGMQYIRFSMEEPKLFQLLFMHEESHIPDINSILPQIDDSYEKIRNSIVEGYGISCMAADKLYRHLWIYSHGIAVLCATKMCKFSADEIQTLLTEVFISLLNGPKKEIS